jgi:hypothetical protein
MKSVLEIVSWIAGIISAIITIYLVFPHKTEYKETNIPSPKTEPIASTAPRQVSTNSTRTSDQFFATTPANQNTQVVERSNINFDINNLTQYFVVKDHTLREGFGQENSIFRIQLKARGNFGGVFKAVTVDRDNIRSPAFIGIDYSDIRRQDIQPFIPRFFPPGTPPGFLFWSEGETQWLQTSLPKDAVSIQVRFTQYATQ